MFDRDLDDGLLGIEVSNVKDLGMIDEVTDMRVGYLVRI